MSSWDVTTQSVVQAIHCVEEPFAELETKPAIRGKSISASAANSHFLSATS